MGGGLSAATRPRQAGAGATVLEAGGRVRTDVVDGFRLDRGFQVLLPAYPAVLRPFLAGVFLDPAMTTSARMFHLIWRSFLRGGGALPGEGMQALPRLLAAGLDVRTGVEVAEVTGDGVRTGDGEHIAARAVVVATDGTTAARLLPGVEPPGWHAVTTFYYRVGERQ